MKTILHASGARLTPRIAADFDILPGEDIDSGMEQVGDTTVVFDVDSKKKKVYVQSVRTPTSKRGQGSARRAMEALLRSTDALGYDVYLGCSPLDKRTRDNRLHAFYESLGFRDTGKYINQAFDPEMKRPAGGA
jgi:predicted GNAT superfamily acetyltransferase